MQWTAGTFELTQQLARRLLPLTLAIGVLLSAGIPATYYLIDARSLEDTATIYAEELAERLGELVFNAPTLWKYQAQKYLQLLHQFVGRKELISIQILDETGRPISTYTHITSKAEVWWNRRSAERYEMVYRALKPFFGGKRLAHITPLLIERYKRVRKEQGRSEVTINRELAFLKNLFS